MKGKALVVFVVCLQHISSLSASARDSAFILVDSSMTLQGVAIGQDTLYCNSFDNSTVHIKGEFDQPDMQFTRTGYKCVSLKIDTSLNFKLQILKNKEVATVTFNDIIIDLDTVLRSPKILDARERGRMQMDSSIYFSNGYQLVFTSIRDYSFTFEVRYQNVSLLRLRATRDWYRIINKRNFYIRGFSLRRFDNSIALNGFSFYRTHLMTEMFYFGTLANFHVTGTSLTEDLYEQVYTSILTLSRDRRKLSITQDHRFEEKSDNYWVRNRVEIKYFAFSKKLKLKVQSAYPDWFTADFAKFISENVEILVELRMQ